MTHFTRAFPDIKNPRRKRYTDSSLASKNIFFKVDIENRTFTLNVSENNRLFHPHFVVERLLRNEEEEKKRIRPSSEDQASFIRRGTPWNCHLRGHVIGHPSSAVAISTSDGMVSIRKFTCL